MLYINYWQEQQNVTSSQPPFPGQKWLHLQLFCRLLWASKRRLLQESFTSSSTVLVGLQNSSSLLKYSALLTFDLNQRKQMWTWQAELCCVQTPETCTLSLQVGQLHLENVKSSSGDKINLDSKDHLLTYSEPHWLGNNQQIHTSSISSPKPTCKDFKDSYTCDFVTDWMIGEDSDSDFKTGELQHSSSGVWSVIKPTLSIFTVCPCSVHLLHNSSCAC